MSTNNYRASFILDTRDYNEPIENLIERLKQVVTSVDGKISEVVNHGNKHFVRVVNRKFPAGVYVQISFEAPPIAPKLIKEKLRLDRNIDRIFIEGIAA
ncbi:MAG: hypothetical protein A2007_01790 [Verrucomicrobia bacterium GWC2_42_7]|nr:MAG: hypothetical protein A2007_01790 [Verrucomicrobia bacterium GWC2_42_7]